MMNFLPPGPAQQRLSSCKADWAPNCLIQPELLGASRLSIHNPPCASYHMRSRTTGKSIPSLRLRLIPPHQPSPLSRPKDREIVCHH
jgi:hypothetical protein